jgi:hypothetical protein
MSQSGLVMRLAVRELWMSFRLLLLLVAFVGASAFVVLVPAPSGILLGRMAAGLGLATVIVAGIAAWSIAAERLAGRAGWLVTRSVGRADVLAGWFWGVGLIVITGVAGAGLLGWLAVFSLPVKLDLGAFALTLAGVAATGIAAVALGLLAGALLRPPFAAVLATLVVGGLGALTWLALPHDPRVPGAALWLVPELTSGRPLVADALRAAGVALAATAVLLAAARLAIERAEL